MEAEPRSGEEMEDAEGEEGEGEEGPLAEVVLETLGDLIAVLETEIEGPLVSSLREPLSRAPDLA